MEYTPHDISPNKRKPVVIALVGIIIIGAIGAVAYYDGFGSLYDGKQAPQKQTTTVPETQDTQNQPNEADAPAEKASNIFQAEEEVSVSADEYNFNEWRTYRSKKRDFAFLYPPILYRGTTANPARHLGGPGGIVASFSNDTGVKLLIIKREPAGGTYQMLDYENDLFFSYNQTTDTWSASNAHEVPENKKVRVIHTDARLKAYVYSSSYGNTNVEAAFVVHPQKEEMYAVELHGPDIKTADILPIIASFSFEDQTEKPQSWDQYKSEEPGLSFEFPTIEGIMTEGYAHFGAGAAQTGVLLRWNLIPDYFFPIGSASNNFTTQQNEEVIHTVKFTEDSGTFFLERPVIDREPTWDATTTFLEVDSIKTLMTANGLEAIIYDAQKALPNVIPDAETGKTAAHRAATVNLPQYYHPHIESITFYFKEPTDMSDIERVVNSLTFSQE